MLSAMSVEFGRPRPGIQGGSWGIVAPRREAVGADFMRRQFVSPRAKSRPGSGKGGSHPEPGRLPEFQ
jgi:hypothetical protein